MAHTAHDYSRDLPVITAYCKRHGLTVNTPLTARHLTDLYSQLHNHNAAHYEFTKSQDMNEGENRAKKNLVAMLVSNKIIGKPAHDEHVESLVRRCYRGPQAQDEAQQNGGSANRAALSDRVAAFARSHAPRKTTSLARGFDVDSLDLDHDHHAEQNKDNADTGHDDAMSVRTFGSIPTMSEASVLPYERSHRPDADKVNAVAAQIRLRDQKKGKKGEQTEGQQKRSSIFHGVGQRLWEVCAEEKEDSASNGQHGGHDMEKNGRRSTVAIGSSVQDQEQEQGGHGKKLVKRFIIELFNDGSQEIHVVDVK
ncbi:hypothetical protein Tdes44962_MAKER06312 [Teratosphaeria destructans]|uniref:Uncharacterized protein n=1 Tax=Teratosphaeria destructans TaxID=418781 RepID=A0A9W7VXQ5_9PEZI|nr:hypothetical protein Tdes44962_MAKER06312 [Teratosphaeria destructans]